jgi:hypothetical protein
VVLNNSTWINKLLEVGMTFFKKLLLSEIERHNQLVTNEVSSSNDRLIFHVEKFNEDCKNAK